MTQGTNDGTWLLLAFLACGAATGCDEAGDDGLEEGTGADIDTDTGADIDTDTGNDLHADCGVLDGECCGDGWCRNVDAVCVAVDTDGTGLCLTSCEPDVCVEQVEGVGDAACFDVSNTNDLGVCFDADDLGAGLEEGNACEASSSNASGRFNGFCCPRSMGGDDLGFGTGEGEAGLASFCGDIDMSTIGEPFSVGDVVGSGVGICLAVPWGTDIVEWCGVPCRFDNSCDSYHRCAPFWADGSEGGYCMPESRRDRVLDPLDGIPDSKGSL